VAVPSSTGLLFQGLRQPFSYAKKLHRQMAHMSDDEADGRTKDSGDIKDSMLDVLNLSRICCTYRDHSPFAVAGLEF